MGGEGLHGDTDPPTGFDCLGGTVGCTCGGKVVGAGKSGWYYDNSHPNKSVICLPSYSTIGGASRHVTGAVISPFSTLNRHQSLAHISEVM